MTDLQPPAAADVERMAGELQALRSELAARNSEFGERIEHQAATIEVLKAMSASPGDRTAGIRSDRAAGGEAVQCADSGGRHVRRNDDPSGDTERVRCCVCRRLRVTVSPARGDGLLDGPRNSAPRVDQVEDITADPGHSFVDVLGHWSVMAVPILRDGVPLGAITIGRPATGPFSDSQVALAANVRRAGGDRNQQRRDLSRIAGAHSGAGAAQQRIRRAHRTPVRDHRRVEGDVSLAG